MTIIDPYDVFRTDLEERLNTFGFGPALPPHTRRSGGLDDQSGIIVGLIPDPGSRIRLGVHNFLSYPPASVFPYPTPDLHSTIGVRHVVKGANANLDPRALMAQHKPELEGLATALKNSVQPKAAIPCGPMQVLANGDSVIGAVKTSPALIDMRRDVLDAAASIGRELNASWGTHLTLARFASELATSERAMVTSAMDHTPRLLGMEFRELFVGVMVVRFGQFELHPYWASELPSDTDEEQEEPEEK